MGIRSDHVERYLSGLRPERPALVREMEELADRDHVPIVEWETARFLATLTRALQPRRVLEVGTAIGYSTLHIAEQLPGGAASSRSSATRAGRAGSDFLARGGVRERVEIVEGDALDTLAGLDGPFDLIFLDATKGEYRRYLDIAEAQSSERAVLILDNLLMQGEVAQPKGQARGWNPDSIAQAQAMTPSWSARSAGSGRRGPWATAWASPFAASRRPCACGAAGSALYSRRLAAVPEPVVEHARRHAEARRDQLAGVDGAGADLALLLARRQQLAGSMRAASSVVVAQHAVHAQHVRARGCRRRS